MTKRIWSAAAMVVSAAALLSLAACTAPGPSQPSNAPPSATSPSATSPSDEAAKPTPTETSSKREAIIVVAGVDVDGAHVTVSGYVNGVIEDGGSCSYEFEGNGTKLVSPSEGIADRITTSCGSASVPIEDFSKGPWVVTLRYESVSDDVVTSEPVDVEIP